MPSASGVYSLPPGYLAVTGQTIQASQHNPPLEDIAAALTLRLSRDGSAPMTGALQLAAGTVSAPAVVCAADPSSGLYKTTAGIGVAISGTKVSEFTAAGIASGAFLVGMLFPFTGSTAPSSLWLLPCGQTVSRTTYPALWAFAQTEIAAGNTFYNNGDGITNFGIGDMRGRVPAGRDNMGGTGAGRLTTASGGLDGTTLGAASSNATHTLTTSEIPSHYHTAGIYDPGHSHTYQIQTNTGGGGTSTFINNALSTANTGTSTTGVRVNSSNGLDTTYSAGGGAAHAIVQPSLVCNYILFAGGPS